MTSPRGVEADVVILTALGLEYDAVRARLTDTRQHTDASGTRYEIGTLSSGPGRVALALIGEGNLTAAALTSRAIDELVPKALILVGVAGGLTDSVSLGDVVIATRIHAYHGGRDEPTGFRPRPKSWPLAHALEQAAREVARTNTWSSSLSSTPAVHFKPIVSGEVVIDTRESHLARLIADHYSDAVAAEMESAGIAESAHRNGFPNTITIRGISDKADGNKRRADSTGWQSHAAANAAAFAAALAAALAERIIQSQPSTGSDHASGRDGTPLRDHLDRPARTSSANVQAGGSLTMKRSVIAGGNVDQSRTIRIGLGGAAVAVVVATALVIGHQIDQGTGPVSPPPRGTIVTQDDLIIAESDPRRYPHGPRYTPITGFLSQFYGSTGIEQFGDDSLKTGNTIAVTIDSKTQQGAYDALSGNGYNGSVVAIRPQTGEILALVSTPSFDPNMLAVDDARAQETAFTRFRDDARNPMLNRATGQDYTPGSTFKLVVAAAALEDGKGKDTQLTAAPSIKITANHDLSNFNEVPCGSGQTASMESALELSCNTAFAQLAHDLGENKLRQQAAKFGVGESDLAVPLPVATSCLGPRTGGDCMNIKDGPALYMSGIGQHDVRLTPLQNAMIAATIANGGERMRPQLIKHSVTPGQPEPMGRAMTRGNANTLRDMMIKSEARTRGDGKVAGLTIASKTATADSGPDPKAAPLLSWYVAFAPADNPKIAIAVLLENKDAVSGGTAAASIGRTTINQALAGGI